MDDMNAQNMAKGLNVYVSGPTGAAMRELRATLTSGGTVVVAGAGRKKALPPLKLKRAAKAK